MIRTGVFSLRNQSYIPELFRFATVDEDVPTFYLRDRYDHRSTVIYDLTRIHTFHGDTGLLHLKAVEYSVSLSYSVSRTDKYYDVIGVPLLAEIGKTPILAHFYVVSIFLNSVAIRTYFLRQSRHPRMSKT